MKRTVLFLLLTAFYLSAALVPLDKAKKVAENYYAHYCAEAASKGSAIINVKENKYEGLITRYTFEFDKGFVIVTADDELYPILGYSDHGKVPKSDQNGGHNFKEWFENYDRQILCAKSKKYIDEDAAILWKDIENNIFPAGKAGIIVDRLVKASWDQVYPWNEDCPLKSDGNWTYVGCTATAMAQVLRYHRWPDVGIGAASYSWNNGSTNITLSANFATHTWNYDLMPEVLNIEYGIYPAYWETGITQAEKDELALQSYWMGLSISMIYGDIMDGGSGAYMADIDNAFNDHWKGTSTYATFYRPLIGAVDESYNTIKAQLDAKRPWVWAGGIHAFVLDGYRDDYWYHFNWGWEGNYDGWYHRSNIGYNNGYEDCDYSAGQVGVTYVPSVNVYAQWPSTTLSGLLENWDDIKLSWDMNYSAVGYKLYRTYSKSAYYSEQTELLIQTSGSEYTDIDLPAGCYSYHVVTVYPDGESQNSNSYSTIVSPVVTYPIVKNLKATTVGRTSIDLAWTKPLTGILNEDVDFEGSTFIPTFWSAKLSLASGGLVIDDQLYIRVLEPSDYDHWVYAYKADGNVLIMSAAVTTQHALWFLSPPITFKDDSYIKWWNRFRYTDDTGAPVPQRPVFQIVSYPGDFTAQDYTQLALYDGNVDPENIWDHEETVSLASLDGVNTRVGFRVADNVNDFYTLAFDNITIGAETSEEIEICEGYEIYRNGSLVKTISGATTVDWSDPFFEDGVNDYYIKALYPTGVSLPCESVSVTVDKNPKPGYLTVDFMYMSDAVLNWYMPYHNPPKWYSYIMPEYCTTVIDGFPDDGTVCQKRRTIFKAEDLGFYYPITLDSVAVGFYDMVNQTNWGGQNTFVVSILVGGSYAIEDTIYTSGTLTAIHNKIITHALPTPLVLSENWNVEITVNATTGYPSTLAAINPAGGHSYYYDTAFQSYDFGMWNGVDWYDWLHMSYITSSVPPPITKSAWVSPVKEIPEKGLEAARKDVVKAPVTNPKALDYYKIYRNGIFIGTSSWLNYTDLSYLIMGYDYLAYKVTAVYANPPGESDPSNEVVVFGTGIEHDSYIPIKTELFQNYPNPFNPETTIKYSLAADGEVRLTVFDISGRAVTELVSSRQGKGIYSVNFNAEDLTSGIYFYQLSLDGEEVHSRKMMMLK